MTLVNLGVLVIKLPLYLTILLILIGSKVKINPIVLDLVTQLQTYVSAPTKMIWVQFLMQNIPVQNQITYQLVKSVSVKEKLNKTLIKTVKSVKKNLQITSHKKTVKMMTVSIKVIHYEKVSLEFPLLDYFTFWKISTFWQVCMFRLWLRQIGQAVPK